MAAYYYRRSHGMTVPREDGLVAGSMALLALFLVSVPLASVGVALVVQLQFSRIFWLLDVAIAYAAWFVVENPPARRAEASWENETREAPTWPDTTRVHIRRAAFALVVVVSLARGSHVTLVERADHALIGIDLPESEWTQVMRWAGQRPVGTNFLADPGHA